MAIVARVYFTAIWSVFMVLESSGCALAVGRSDLQRQPYLAIPEEDYRFLSVTNGPCFSGPGERTKLENDVVCKSMSPLRRYRGTWFVAFETSLFMPLGNPECGEVGRSVNCAELVGKALPWPSRWACPRKFAIEFIGKRNLQPQYYDDVAYKIVVQKVISIKRLPDPPYEPNECDPHAP